MPAAESFFAGYMGGGAEDAAGILAGTRAIAEAHEGEPAEDSCKGGSGPASWRRAWPRRARGAVDRATAEALAFIEAGIVSGQVRRERILALFQERSEAEVLQGKAPGREGRHDRHPERADAMDARFFQARIQEVPRTIHAERPEGPPPAARRGSDTP